MFRNLSILEVIYLHAYNPIRAVGPVYTTFSTLHISDQIKTHQATEFNAWVVKRMHLFSNRYDKECFQSMSIDMICKLDFLSNMRKSCALLFLLSWHENLNC